VSSNPTSSRAPLWDLHQPAPELVTAWQEAGLWRREPLPLGRLVDDSLQRYAERPFTFRSEYRPWKGTYGEIRQLALRAAEGLAQRGISSGDIVAFQLPNWVEAAITFYAVTYLGAVIVPIVHTYGPKEVAYILRRSDVRLFVTADRFGHTDHSPSSTRSAPTCRGSSPSSWSETGPSRRAPSPTAPCSKAPP
jgi:acyl-CoA synthetase